MQKSNFSPYPSPWEDAPLINDDAIFIADSHFMPLNTPMNEQSKNASESLLKYFKSLMRDCKNIPSQIFLMGDITHLLIGGIHSSYKVNQTFLTLLDSLSQYTKIWWFEGNHDFRLKAFKNLKNIIIIPRTNQPKAFCYTHKNSTKHLLLAHGDIFLNLKYEMYIRLMNTKTIGFFMRLLDYITFGNLYGYITAKVNHNIIRNGKVDMTTFAPMRIQAYHNYLRRYKNIALDDAKIHAIIEGHFHIGKTYENKETLYVSLPSFYINRGIFSIRSIFI